MSNRIQEFRDLLSSRISKSGIKKSLIIPVTVVMLAAPLAMGSAASAQSVTGATDTASQMGGVCNPTKQVASGQTDPSATAQAPTDPQNGQAQVPNGQQPPQGGPRGPRGPRNGQGGQQNGQQGNNNTQVDPNAPQGPQDGQGPNQGRRPHLDIEGAATKLGVTTQALCDALGIGQPPAVDPNATPSADMATPSADGQSQNGPQGGPNGGRGPRGPRIDLEAAAQKLGVTVDALRDALGLPAVDPNAAPPANGTPAADATAVAQ